MDTNVLLVALINESGALHKILRLIINEKINLALSTQIILEHDDVLKREEILKLTRLNIEQVEDVLDLLVLLAQKQKIYYRLRSNLSDENDNLFVECAFASKSNYLIASNIRDFERSELRGFEFKVLTPKDFYQMWRKSDE